MKEEEFHKGEFGSQFGPEFKQLPPIPKTVEEYEKKANPDLKAYNRRIVKDDYYKLMKFALIGLGIFCTGLLYLMYGGYLQDDIKIPDCVCQPPPACPVAPACPAMNCPACTCPTCHNICEFPSEFKINLNDSTG